jgi:hypothetical protein
MSLCTRCRSCPPRPRRNLPQFSAVSVPLPAIARARISAWLNERGRHSAPLWIGQRGQFAVSGITQVVPAVGADAGSLGHASLDTSARRRPERSGSAENAAVIERVFDK